MAGEIYGYTCSKKFARHMRAFLAEHARREALPRTVCLDCQHEYSAEDKHVCPPNLPGTLPWR